MSYREFAYYYDRLMEDMPYSSWMEFIQGYWENSVSGKQTTVVDLGCGTGNLTIPLAQQGYVMTGIDLSSDMLAIARQKQEQIQQAGKSKLSIQWLQQDMTEWALHTKVDAVISFCDCLNYLLEEEQIVQTFRQVYEGLEPGGSFIFDVHTKQVFEEYAIEQPFVWNEEDIAYIWNCSLDHERSEIEHELTIFAKETLLSHKYPSRVELNPPLPAVPDQQVVHVQPSFRRIEEIHTQRAYSLDWLHGALKETGFSTIECYADFTMNPPTDQTKRAFFVALK